MSSYENIDENLNQTGLISTEEATLYFEILIEEGSKDLGDMLNRLSTELPLLTRRLIESIPHDIPTSIVDGEIIVEDRLGRYFGERLFELGVHAESILDLRVRNNSFLEFSPTYKSVVEEGVPSNGSVVLFGSVSRYTSHGFLRFCQLHLDQFDPIIIDPEGYSSFIEGVSRYGTIEQNNLADNSVSMGMTTLLLDFVKLDGSAKKKFYTIAQSLKRILKPGGRIIMVENEKISSVFVGMANLAGLEILSIENAQRIMKRRDVDEYYRTGVLKPETHSKLNRSYGIVLGK